MTLIDRACKLLKLAADPHNRHEDVVYDQLISWFTRLSLEDKAMLLQDASFKEGISEADDRAIALRIYAAINSGQLDTSIIQLALEAIDCDGPNAQMAGWKCLASGCFKSHSDQVVDCFTQRVMVLRNTRIISALAEFAESALNNVLRDYELLERIMSLPVSSENIRVIIRVAEVFVLRRTQGAAALVKKCLTQLGNNRLHDEQLLYLLEIALDFGVMAANDHLLDDIPLSERIHVAVALLSHKMKEGEVSVVQDALSLCDCLMAQQIVDVEVFGKSMDLSSLRLSERHYLASEVAGKIPRELLKLSELHWNISIDWGALSEASLKYFVTAALYLSKRGSDSLVKELSCILNSLDMQSHRSKAFLQLLVQINPFVAHWPELTSMSVSIIGNEDNLKILRVKAAELLALQSSNIQIDQELTARIAGLLHVCEDAYICDSLIQVLNNSRATNYQLNIDRLMDMESIVKHRLITSRNLPFAEKLLQKITTPEWFVNECDGLIRLEALKRIVEIGISEEQLRSILLVCAKDPLDSIKKLAVEFGDSDVQQLAQAHIQTPAYSKDEEFKQLLSVLSSPALHTDCE